MLRLISAGLILACATVLPADDVLPRIDQRFAPDAAEEVPDFRQHIVPLLGQLGCNGRACHGAFQGQGGFRLSLFGYDFKADHENLAAGENPRVNIANPAESLALKKPLMIEEHEGGKRFEPGSWQHHVLRNWIRSGAKGLSETMPDFVRLDITPAEIVAANPAEEFQLRAVAVWSNGVHEDVTPLCRFQTNNDEIATVDAAGRVAVQHPGDTHIVVFYDNSVVPVEVLLPVGPEHGDKYPTVPAPTKIDELITGRLRKLGIVPSELCTDTEFLRRVSLDLTGTLPTSKEVEAFLADSAPDKRTKKIDELLERPGYAAWWATKFCDYTGNSGKQLNNVGALGVQQVTKEWFEWIRVRIEKNVPYDELASGIVVAISRKPEESYADYCSRMSGYYHADAAQKFESQDSLPYYWARKNFTKPEDRALGFAYTFLGVRIQCAQCHKHPFDQWTKDDFDRFTSFFSRVSYGNGPSKAEAKEMFEKLGLDPKLNKNKQAQSLAKLLKEGSTVPFPELFVPPAKKPDPEKMKKNAKNAKNAKKQPQLVKGRTAKYLGGEEVKLDEVDDPRTLLMDWLRDEENPYFAKAFVNRVWAGYFHRGIVEPPDDLSLANPPSNAALLDYLATEFRARGYDMKWLHREIANSRTYQLSWKTNDTNRQDHRNFSHAEPRRLPAEVALDAIQQATASEQQNAKWPQDLAPRAIADGSEGKKGAGYVLNVFGKSLRASNCDCDRSNDASLLQTVYMQNDQELLNTIDRKGGWIAQVGNGSTAAAKAESTADQNQKQDQRRKATAKQVNQLKKKLKKAQKQNPPDEKLVGQLKQQFEAAEKRLAKLTKVADAPKANEAAIPVASLEVPTLIREAYLRTVSRPPTDEEVQRAKEHVLQSGDLAQGTRDLLWALLNTKEFLLNH